MSLIASILPKGEGFSPKNFGAIALCVRDFTCHSNYRSEIAVIGGVKPPGFEGLHYESMAAAKWYENRTRAYANACTEFIRTENIKLAEIHNRPAFLRLLAGKVECKLALHLHNDPQEMDAAHSRKERRKLLEICSAVYCVSTYIRDRFAQGLERGALAKLHIIHNGIESPTSLPEKENIIVFAGRMTEGKGAMVLAQALRIALPGLPDWKAVFIGSRRHEETKKMTPHEEQIAKILQPLGGKAQMLGFLSHTETLDYFARSAIAVVPSVWAEPFGRTAIEAMAYGCVLISSGRGGLREVTGDAAFTLADLTPQRLAEAIIMLANNANERKRLQLLARERAVYFSIARCTNLLDKVREEILMGT